MDEVDVDESLPGWYRQQSDPTMLRWWDGSGWTDDVLPVPDGLDDQPAVADGADGAERTPAHDDEHPSAAAAGAAGDEAPIPIGDRRFAGTFGEAPLGDEPVRAPVPTRRPRAEPQRSAEQRSEPRRADPRRAGPRRPAPRRPEAGRGAARLESRQAPARRAPSAGSPPPRRPVARGAWQPVRSPRGRHARRSHTQQFARIAVRAVLVALVAGAGYLLLEPFLDGGGSARTLAEDPRPTTTTLPPPANGALPGEDGDTAAASDAKPLSAALLQLADLPASWGVQAESSAARAGFCGGRNPLTVLVPTEELHAAFSKGLEGPFIVDLALRYDTSEQAEKLMDLVAETLETCRTYDENGSQITLSPLDFPKLGDSTFAAHLTGATSLGPLEGDLVWVRKGDRVMSISTVAFGDFDVDLLKLVSEAAARRL